MQKRLFITLFLCLSSLVTLAQTDDNLVDEGSVYSQFGVGFPVDYGSSAANGLGILGVSYMEPYVPSMANPAHWGSTVYGMATGGIGIDNFNTRTNSESASNSLISVNEFQLQLPVYKNKLGVSASFSPYSTTAFQVLGSDTRIIGNGVATDTLNFQTQNTGSGGINRFEMGLGWKINDHISIGYAASLMFASIDNEYQSSIDNDNDPTNDNTTNPYQDVIFTHQTSASGFGNRVGVYFTFPSLTNEDDQLNIGATVNFPVKLEGERVQENIFVSGEVDEDIERDQELAKGSIELPLGFAAGLTYELNNKIAISTDGLYQKWSNYSNDLNAGDEGVFKDRFKIGAGVRYFPFFSRSDKFLSQFKYRFGTSYDTGHLSINDKNISTVKFSAGIGILSPRSNSTIDLSFEYGFRGTKSESLVKENIWGVKLSLNLAELFFFRPKLQ